MHMWLRQNDYYYHKYVVNVAVIVYLNQNTGRHKSSLAIFVWDFIPMNYSYSNDCSAFCQFYSNLKIFQNNKRIAIVSGEKFKAIALVVYLIGMT